VSPKTSIVQQILYLSTGAFSTKLVSADFKPLSDDLVESSALAEVSSLYRQEFRLMLPERTGPAD
jgi:hypothetical protein